MLIEPEQEAIYRIQYPDRKSIFYCNVSGVLSRRTDIYVNVSRPVTGCMIRDIRPVQIRASLPDYGILLSGFFIFSVFFSRSSFKDVATFTPVHTYHLRSEKECRIL